MSKSGENEKKGFEKKKCNRLFTDTAAILNYLDLRSIMVCPEGISAIRYTRISIYALFLGQFFFKIS